MQAYVHAQVENGIGEITFFHPKSNSMPSAQLEHLALEVEKLGADEKVKVIILKSEGERVFCSGASFDELLAIRDFQQGKHFFSGFARVINAMRKAPKFIIARVQGKVVGGGVGIAAAADYAVATECSSLKLSELSIGIGPFVVGPVVERKMGASAFSQLFINATAFQTAHWAREKGLFSEIYPSMEEMDQAISILAKNLAKSSPDAMKELKKINWQGTEHWDQLLQERAEISGRLVLSDFTINAIGSFKMKS